MRGGLICDKFSDNPYIYRLKLPGETGAHVNSYFLVSGREILIVDPPIYKPKHIQLFQRALDQMSISEEDVFDISVFFTHIHGEFSRMCPKMLSQVKRVYISEDGYRDYKSYNDWEYKMNRFRREGFPDDVMARLFTGGNRSQNPELDSSGMELVLIQDQDLISFAGYHLHCLHTPGPGKGHYCLLLEEEKLLFSGLLVIDGGYPAADVWKGRSSALKNLLISLEKVKMYRTVRAFPGTGEPLINIDRYIEHSTSYYSMRLVELYQLILDYPGKNAYELSLRFGHNPTGTFRVSDRNKWKMMKETLACLVLLRAGRYVTSRKNGKHIGNYPGSAMLSDYVKRRDMI